MTSIDKEKLEEALGLLGTLMGDDGLGRLHLILCGGAALIATGQHTRTTDDADVLAMQNPDGTFAASRPLPNSLIKTVAQVGRDLGLREDWLNDGPSNIFAMGMPEGYESRLLSRQFGSNLTVSFIGRWDQVHLKLYALCNNAPYRHFQDLDVMDVTEEEIQAAASWVARRYRSTENLGELKHWIRELGYAELTTEF